ncbi:MAG: restriction endonuclease subunit S [Verrucomicrobiales bacterium]|nr:restriction endonuclease subunit S [Verrucomicrobiales bacterium]MBP9225702.1 restriction endonuclease subunit S [Verrucomicrobiales bacterium]
MKLTKHALMDLYEMGSGISSKPEQAGHGAPFCSFTTVFNSYFLPSELPDRMDASAKEQETYSLKKGDILLTRTSETLDELGMSCVADTDYPNATFSGFLKRLRPTQEHISYHRFMAFYLRSPLFRKTMTNNAVMTLRCSFNEQIFSYLNILLPTFDQQMGIGDLLFRIHAKIDLNRRINAELEAMAKLLYDYWFVQFDFPISAAQATAMGRPDLEGKPYRTSGGKMVYNKELKREIPEGWEVRAIADYCSLNAATWTIKSRPDVIHYVDLANTKAGRINEVTSLKKEIAPSRAQRILRPGDTIIGTVRPENGSYACVPKSNEILTGSTGFAVLTPKSPSFREFNYLGLTSRLNITRLSVIASGAAYPAVNPEVVAALPIPSPPETLIDGFHAATSASFDLIETNNEQTQHLTQLRDWLLPMLMNGQVTVGDPAATQEG